MKQYLLSALAMAGASALTENLGEFMEFASKHSKSYTSMEEF
jgi:hypothetical protein